MSPTYYPRRPAPVNPTPPGILDSHIHLLCDDFVQAVRAAGDDPTGYLVTNWSLSDTLKSMDARGVSKALISFTSPGPLIGGAEFVHSMNLFTQKVVAQSNGRFGWYASLPSWDVEGDAYRAVIAEAEWALTQAGADGIIIMTSYGDRLPGDPKFRAIWDKLDELHAVVFIHPSEVKISPRFVASKIPQPLVDYPMATTRAATDLVATKTMALHPNVKVILSHAGGTLPYLAERIITLSSLFGLSEEECRRDMRRFYLDLALGTSRAQLKALLEFADPTHLVYGSDWPYVTLNNAVAGMNKLQTFIKQDPQGHFFIPAWRENLMKLFGWK